MSLKMNESPYQRSPRTTFKIMLELSAALLIVWLAAVIYNFTLSAELGLRAILLMVVAVAFTAFIDAVVALIRHKKGQDIVREVVDGVVHNYSYVTAIIFTLCCPVYVSYYVIIIGCLFSTGIKHCFGGFGKNIFNPAIIGRIVTGVFFGDAFSVPSKFVEADFVASSTVTSQYNTLSGTTSTWLSGSLPEGYNLSRILLGNYVGAMGETFAVLILVLGILLAIRGVINWRSSAFYLGTVAITSFVVALFVDGLNPFTYVVYHLALGGLMFGAIFMITDPVTSPTSPFGKALIGVIAGLLTVLFRLDSNNPEGVMFSIAIVNIVSPIIDRLVVGRTTDGHGKKWGIIGGFVAASVVINTAISVGNLKASETTSSSSTTSSSVVSSSTSSSSTVVELTDNEKLFGLVGAEYTETTFAALPQETGIKKVYLAKVAGADKALCYLVEGTFEVDTMGYQGDSMTFTAGISIDLNSNTYISVNVLNDTAGTGLSYSQSAIAYVKTYLENKTVDDIVKLDVDANFDVNANPTGTGAIYSTKGLLKLTIEASNQYLSDRPVYLFGNAETTYEKVDLSNADESILEAYTYTLEGVKYISYIVAELNGIEVGSDYGVMGTIKPSIILTINTSNDTVTGFKVTADKTTPGYSVDPEAVLKASVVGKTTAELAALNPDTSYDVTAKPSNGGGAVYSVNGIAKLVVKACSQYENTDKALINGGAN